MCPLGPIVSNPSVFSGHPCNKMSGGFPRTLLEGAGQWRQDSAEDLECRDRLISS